MSAVQSFIDSLRGERIAGRYVVERVLGAGGMGFVASARYPELDQLVAIKFLRPEHASDAVTSARFLREARVAAKVTSPHFVKVFDLGQLDSGAPYLVMELLTGRDLGDELEARGPLPIEEAVDYVLQACVGLAEVHSLSIVHRDLKPANIFLAETAGSRLVKVLDFGISKQRASATSPALTSTDHVMGTPQYMSPEQIKASKSVDARSDIWSMGVILHELVAGEMPFVSEHGGIGEIFGAILHTDPVPLRKMRPEAPEGLEEVILKCLRRERADRFESIADMADALRPFAPSGSVHRIEAVRKALTSGVSSADLASVEDASGSAQATARSSPGAKRGSIEVDWVPGSAPVSSAATPLESAKTTPAVIAPKGKAPLETLPSEGARKPADAGEAKDPPREGPITSMTSSSPSRPAAKTGRSATTWALVGVVAVGLVGGSAYALRMTKTEASVSPPLTNDTAVAPAPAPPPALPASVPIEPPVESVSVSASQTAPPPSSALPKRPHATPPPPGSSAIELLKERR